MDRFRDEYIRGELRFGNLKTMRGKVEKVWTCRGAIVDILDKVC